MKYFEDFAIGEKETVGTYQLTEKEIIAFGKKWDPQPIHTDSTHAEKSIFKGIIAAGTHLMSIAIRQLVSREPRVAVLAALGWDEVRFHAPARPGDTLTLFRECVEARPSQSKPDRGVVKNCITMTNSDDHLLLSYVDTILVARRP